MITVALLFVSVAAHPLASGEWDTFRIIAILLSALNMVWSAVLTTLIFSLKTLLERHVEQTTPVVKKILGHD